MAPRGRLKRKREEEEEEQVEYTAPPADGPWSQGALASWRRQPATEAAMSGLKAQHSAMDLRGSQAFLQELQKLLSKRSVLQKSGAASPRQESRGWPGLALDVGAGVGRNSLKLLLPLQGLRRLDLVEPAPKLRAAARKALKGKDKVGRFFSQPIQAFTPVAAYDLVWIQWVFMYVPPAEVVKFLQRLRLRLAEGGVVAVKENVENRKEEEGFDPKDFCETRRASRYEEMFREAGLRIVLKRRQREWPTQEGYFPLMMWALCPEK